MSDQAEYKEWVNYDFEIFRGTDKEVQVVVYDENNVLVNLTSYKAYMQIRNKPNGVLYLSLTETSGITLGGVLGTVQISITDTQSKLFNWKYAEYDLILENSTGTRTGFMKGKISVVEADTIIP